MSTRGAGSGLRPTAGERRARVCACAEAANGSAAKVLVRPAASGARGGAWAVARPPWAGVRGRTRARCGAVVRGCGSGAVRPRRRAGFGTRGCVSHGEEREEGRALGAGARRVRDVRWQAELAKGAGGGKEEEREGEGRKENRKEKEKMEKRKERKRRGKKGGRDSRRYRRSVGHARRLGARVRRAGRGRHRVLGTVSGLILRESGDWNRRVSGKLGLGFFKGSRAQRRKTTLARDLI